MLDRMCAFAGEVTLVDKAAELYVHKAAERTVLAKLPHLTRITTLLTTLVTKYVS